MKSYQVTKSQLEEKDWDFSSYSFDVAEKLTVDFETNHNNDLVYSITNRKGNVVSSWADENAEKALEDVKEIKNME